MGVRPSSPRGDAVGARKLGDGYPRADGEQLSSGPPLMAGARSAPQLLSVIVPSYNERRTIRNALDALLKTELPLRVEVIVVDDGSTDGTNDYLAQLVDAGTIRLIRHETNLGKGAAIHTGR